MNGLPPLASPSGSLVFLPLARPNQQPQARDPQMVSVGVSLPGHEGDGEGWRADLEQQMENIQPHVVTRLSGLLCIWSLQ